MREYGQAAFKVDSAAAPDVAVFNEASEWVHRPFLTLNSNHIRVSCQQDGLLAAVAAQPGNEMGLSFLRGGDDVDLEAQRFEFGFEEFREFAFVAGRVACVDSDHVGQEARHLRGVLGSIGGVEPCNRNCAD